MAHEQHFFEGQRDGLSSKECRVDKDTDKDTHPGAPAKVAEAFRQT